MRALRLVPLMLALCVAGCRKNVAARDWSSLPGHARLPLTSVQGVADADERRSLVWSPDGRLFATEGLETIQIWDANGLLVASLVEDTSGIAWTSDGAALIASEADGGVLVVRATDASVHRFPPPKSGLACNWVARCPLLVSHDGTRLAVPLREGFALWDLTAGKLLTVKALDRGWRDDWATDGETIALENVHTFDVYDIHTGERRSAVKPDEAYYSRVALAPGGAPIARGSLDGHVRFFASANGAFDATMRTSEQLDPQHETLDVQFDPHGKLLAISDVRHLALWDGHGALRRLGSERADRTSVEERAAIRWSTDGARVAVSYREELRLFDVASGTLLSGIKGYGVPSPLSDKAVMLSGGLMSIAEMPHGGVRVVAPLLRADDTGERLSADGRLARMTDAIVDLSTGYFAPEGVVYPEREALAQLGFPEDIEVISAPSPDGARVVANPACNLLGLEHCPCIFGVASKRCEVPLPDARAEKVMLTFRWSPDGARLSYRSGAFGSAVQIFDATTGARTDVIPGRANDQSWVTANIVARLDPLQRVQLVRLTDGASLEVIERMVDGTPRIAILRDDGAFDGHPALSHDLHVRATADLRAPLRSPGAHDESSSLTHVAALYQAFLEGRP